MLKIKEQTITLRWRDVRTRENVSFSGPLPITIGRSNGQNTVSLESRMVSATHARVEWQNGDVMLVDLGSHNGTAVEGFPISQPTKLTHGSRFQIGAFNFTLTMNDEVGNEQPTAKGTAMAVPETLTNVLPPPFPAQAQQAQFPPAIFRLQKVPIQQLMQETAVETTTYLAIGGGLGSFSWVNHLVICGANPADIVSIGFDKKPYGRYQRLCQNSQIPAHERLRSNSDSCPDNMWGWPGYGVREVWHETFRGNLGQAAKISWQLFNEPFVQTYTPRAGAVFAAIDREANRMGWQNIWRQGRVRAIRQTDDGRFVVAYSQMNPDGSSRHRLIVAPYLHLAVGYPGARFLPDLQKYRQQTGDFEHVVNAYEDHNHLYDALAQRGGTVLIRGRGIVASRLIQRLYEVQQQTGLSIHILHLMREPNEAGAKFRQAQREVRNHWEHQPFNWPKAAWGGDLRQMLAESGTQTRGNLLSAWGGTTTADRTDWQEIIEQGLMEGWYEIQFGQVESVALVNGRLQTTFALRDSITEQVHLLADYIIDATGLESGIDASPLLHDLASHYQLPRNAQKRLKVSNQFELTALRNGAGRAYASGIATLGGPFAAVDSFLGLQYAALCVTDDLIAQRAPSLKRLNGVRSIHQWLRWAKGAKP